MVLPLPTALVSLLLVIVPPAVSVAFWCLGGSLHQEVYVFCELGWPLLSFLHLPLCLSICSSPPV